jgi:ABC-type dipeptide/oligopeptide/nickel transport system ATPase component
MNFSVDAGTSLLFVGANGGGKTRLAVKIEQDLGIKAHRVSAHRALSLDPSIPKVSERLAIIGLRLGYANPEAVLPHRAGNRWRGNAATSLLNDYDFLLQSLFAEQGNTSLVTHKDARAGRAKPPKSTKFEKLNEIWDRTLPQRRLEITGDDIQVSIPGSTTTYSASEMSDGERAVFYLIGQTLLAETNSLIIFDEPELHVHRSIMSVLWDELEAARPDCAMVLISHDLEFVASREGQKFVIRDYEPTNGWTIEPVPEGTGFTDEITTLILGSRRPILFVEGQSGSLDQAIYRVCYPSWTIIPRGSCEEVVHAVVTMRANAALTRVTCAGLVDADAYAKDETDFLDNHGIAVLPVSEIENLFLLPTVVEAIASGEGYKGNDLKTKITSVYDELFQQASDATIQLPIVMRYCRRRIDRTLKKIDLSSAASVPELVKAYAENTRTLDVSALAKLAEESIAKAIASRDAPGLLRWYDNKGVLAIACKAKNTTRALFEQWITRVLLNNSAPAVSEAIKKTLPNLVSA